MVCSKQEFLLEISTAKEVMRQESLPWYLMLIPAFIKDFHSVSSSALVSVNTLFLAVSQNTQRMEINVNL